MTNPVVAVAITFDQTIISGQDIICGLLRINILKYMLVKYCNNYLKINTPLRTTNEFEKQLQLIVK
jgi:hypothetical protein